MPRLVTGQQPPATSLQACTVSASGCPLHLSRRKFLCSLETFLLPLSLPSEAPELAPGELALRFGAVRVLLISDWTDLTQAVSRQVSQTTLTHRPMRFCTHHRRVSLLTPTLPSGLAGQDVMCNIVRYNNGITRTRIFDLRITRLSAANELHVAWPRRAAIPFPGVFAHILIKIFSGLSVERIFRSTTKILNCFIRSTQRHPVII